MSDRLLHHWDAKAAVEVVKTENRGDLEALGGDDIGTVDQTHLFGLLVLEQFFGLLADLACDLNHWKFGAVQKPDETTGMCLSIAPAE